jgi:proteasome regulatory subunit
LIKIPLPDLTARLEILKIHTKKMHLADISLEVIASLTDGATGAELQAICREAGMMAVRRDAPSVEMKDFADAVRKVKTDTTTDTRMYT